MTTKAFDIGTVLSITTGRLLTKPTNEHTGNGIGHLYEILGHMTNDVPFTHSLGRFSDACKPVLLETFPELSGVDLTMLADTLEGAETPQEGIQRWLDLACIKFGLNKSYEIEEGCASIKYINPVAELQGMVGADKVAVVTI